MNTFTRKKCATPDCASIAHVGDLHCIDCQTDSKPSNQKCARPACRNRPIPGTHHCDFHQGERAAIHQMPDDNWKPTNPKDAEALADNRVSLSLFPDTAVVAGALAFTEGDAKYGGHNFRIDGVRAMTYADAEERHMKAWRNGEDIDPESKLPHLWKALACIAVLIDAEACGMLNDDRPPPAPVADMIRKLKADVARLREQHKDRKVRRFTRKDKPNG